MTFIFKLIDMAKDSYYVIGVGDDVDLAEVDARERWATWAAAQEYMADRAVVETVEVFAAEDMPESLLIP